MSSVDKIKIQRALVADTYGSADVNGDDVFVGDAESVTLCVDVGVSGDTLSGSVYFQLKLEAAADDGTGSPDTYAAVTDADDVYSTADTPLTVDANGVFATINDPAEDDTQYIIEYNGKGSGKKAWVRVVIDKTGTHTNGTPMSASASSLPNFNPVVQ